MRAALGVGPDEPLCVVTVGGSGVGAPLLRRVLDAVPLVRAARAGPAVRRSSPARASTRRRCPRRRGRRCSGYVPDLYRHLAACDVAVVQGGLTTCMELTALRKPFVYVPLRHHFEQNFHVRARLDRYGAGRHLPTSDALDPDGLAEAIAKEVGREVAYRPGRDRRRRARRRRCWPSWSDPGRREPDGDARQDEQRPVEPSAPTTSPAPDVERDRADLQEHEAGDGRGDGQAPARCRRAGHDQTDGAEHLEHADRAHERPGQIVDPRHHLRSWSRVRSTFMPPE